MKSTLIPFFLIPSLLAGCTTTGSNPVADMPSWRWRRGPCGTDTARGRRSLVDQIVSAYLTRLGRDRPVKTLERLAANTHGASIADAMIAQMLTEENLANILNTGAIRSSGNTVANIPRLIDIDTSSVIETLRRISPVKPVEFFVRLGPRG
jgi:hypothetical protein